MKKSIIIEGMSCGHCTNHVKEGLMEINSVTNVTVDLESKKALIEYEENINDEEIKNIIEELGYEVLEIEEV